MTKRVRLVGVRAELLQTFRLSHALAEAGVRLAVSPSQAVAYRRLDQYFDDIDWRVTRFARPLTDVFLAHDLPLTRVGKVERPLILPHAILDRCRRHWAKRQHLMTFSGLMTEARLRTLRPFADTFAENFHIVATEAGREWPQKAWDDEYYSTLGRSQLTACPNGDFVWTYRFFEAAMCGSIPVVEDTCDQYAGFLFYRMTDDPADLRWRVDWAEHNADLARRRLTAPHDALVAAVHG